MLKLLGKIPLCKFHVACSGGSDSMILVDFLRRYPNNKFDILHFNHGTNCCNEAEQFVRGYCADAGIDCHVGRISSEKPKNKSQEEHWRDERYAFFSKFGNAPILMAHHLNDAIETWIMTSAVGNPHLIPYRNEKYGIIRPLLATSKSDIEKWAKDHSVPYVIDKSNYDTNIKRNYVRHVLLGYFKTLNPGIETTIRNKILEAYSDLP